MSEAKTQTSISQIKGEELADVKVAPTLLRQVVLGLANNQRRSTAHTKKRGEVSGGGRKPWRQKGTGRARVGSSRTPLWRGGGIIFGPTNELNYQKALPTRMRKQALLMALKLKHDKSLLFEIKNPLGKTMKEAKAGAPELFSLRNALVVVSDANTALAIRNAKNIFPINVSRVNALMVAGSHNVVFLGDTYAKIIKRAKNV